MSTGTTTLQKPGGCTRPVGLRYARREPVAIRGRTQTTIYLVSPVLVQMWAAGEPGPDADLATVGVGAVPVQMLRGRAQSRCRCGRLGQG